MLSFSGNSGSRIFRTWCCWDMPQRRPIKFSSITQSGILKHASCSKSVVITWLPLWVNRWGMQCLFILLFPTACGPLDCALLRSAPIYFYLQRYYWRELNAGGQVYWSVVYPDHWSHFILLLVLLVDSVALDLACSVAQQRKEKLFNIWLDCLYILYLEVFSKNQKYLLYRRQTK